MHDNRSKAKKEDLSSPQLMQVGLLTTETGSVNFLFKIK